MIDDIGWRLRPIEVDGRKAGALQRRIRRTDAALAGLKPAGVMDAIDLEIGEEILDDLRLAPVVLLARIPVRHLHADENAQNDDDDI
jgi:hypothetical protein